MLGLLSSDIIKERVVVSDCEGQTYQRTLVGLVEGLKYLAHLLGRMPA
jgi:hypothetical protein